MCRRYSPFSVDVIPPVVTIPLLRVDIRRADFIPCFDFQESTQNDTPVLAHLHFLVYSRVSRITRLPQ